MRLLLTNDDGIDAPGLEALVKAVKGLGSVFVVAPRDAQSATSHAITLHRPLEVEPREFSWGEGYAVNGRPADCTKLGLAGVLPGAPGAFDFVISGINAGANIGQNVLYSGTVGAAREAAFEGVPAIAVSLHLDGMKKKPKTLWERASEHARDAIERTVAVGLEAGTLMNINLPILEGDKEPKGTRLVTTATKPMRAKYKVHKAVPRPGSGTAGVGSYSLQGTMNVGRPQKGSDAEALFDGYVTLSPLHFDLNCEASHERWAAAADG